MMRLKLLDISCALFFLLFTTNALVASSYCDPHCKQNVHISLAYNCEKTITAYDVLYNPSSSCTYYITVYNQYGQPIGNTVNANYIGQTLDVKVTAGPYSCWATIYVTDYHAPIAVCDVNTQVSLGSDGRARVYAQTFNDGSYDNCALGPIKVRRMTAGWCPPGFLDDTQFRDFVEFCCEDIGNSPLQVVLRVHDLAGNYNECMVNVYVEDKLPPQIHCPTDITVSCDYNFDIWDLSQFGKVVTNYHDRDQIYIDDYYYPNHHAGIDGFTTDNCGVWISDYADPYIECGQGFINRVFTASSGGGMTSSCVQKIYIKDPHPFNHYDIHWPYDVSIDGCGPQNLDPAATGVPLFNDDHCSIVATSYSDEIFVVQENACYKVLRHWKVLDWCQYNPHYPNHGIWEHTQVIKLLNSQPPVFASCGDVTFTTDIVQGCTGRIDLPGNATDDCTPDSLLNWEYFIDFNNDGGPLFGMYDIKGTSGDASGYYPFGTHKIIWRVEDLCGNIETCQYLFTVVDGKKPSPVCYHGLATVVMPSSGMITLDASFFNVSSFDNCTPANELRYSFTGDLNDSQHTFNCGDLDTNEVRIYVHDNAGNKDYCTTYVLIQDNNDVCPPQPMIFLESDLYTRGGEGVEDAQVYLEETNRAMEVEMTDIAGHAEFRSWIRIEEQEYEVHAVKTGDFDNGISITDLILLQRHILGYQEMTDPYDLLAGDIDGNHTIDILDLVRLRLLILGNVNHFNGNTSWLFVPAGTEFDRPDDPYDFDAVAESMGSTDQPGKVDFTAVKVGDLNMSAAASRRSHPGMDAEVVLHSEARVVQAGELFDLIFYSKEETDINGLQMTLNFDPELVTFEGTPNDPGVFVHYEFNLDELDRGSIPMVAFRDTRVQETTEAGASIFILSFRANSRIETAQVFSLSIDGIRPGVTTGEFTDAGLQLLFEEKSMGEEEKQPSSAIWITENPFSKSTELSIEIPDAKWLKIYIFDQSGRLLRLSENDNASGFRMRIQQEELGNSGVYYLRILTDQFNETRKLILIE